jgi:hypothetical protein
VISSTVLRGVAFGFGLAIMPTAAFAVVVSSGDGSGTQYRAASYSNGAYADGYLRSSAGNPVYYSGKLDLNNCTDPSTGRYTGDVRTTSGIAAGGAIRGDTRTCGLQGVKARVCRNVNNLPDPCGPDSLRF